MVLICSNLYICLQNEDFMGLRKIGLLVKGTLFSSLIFLMFSSCFDKFGGHHPSMMYSIYLESDTLFDRVIISYPEAKTGEYDENNVVIKEVELPFRSLVRANYTKDGSPDVFLKVTNVSNGTVRGLICKSSLSFDSVCTVSRVLGIEESAPESKCAEVPKKTVFEYLNKINYPCIIDASKNKLEVNLNDWKEQ